MHAPLTNAFFSAAMPRRILLVALIIFLTGSTGCVSIPNNLESNISWRGAHFTRMIRLSSVFLVSTASILPGKEQNNTNRNVVTSCSDSKYKISVNIESDRVNDHQINYCGTLLSAIKFVVDKKPAGNTNFTYNITLVPSGVRYSKSNTSVQLSNSIHLDYALPMDESAIEQSIASGTTTIAHETFHAISSLQRVHRSARDEEALAYKIGICSQFFVTGNLSLSFISRANIENNEIDGSAGVSASIGIATAQIFHKYFKGAQVIFRDTESGHALTHDCNELMVSAFTNPI